jgi:hypothetical protein
VYHPAFAGSYSLKQVLPALLPQMTYAGMPVANGEDARIAWRQMIAHNLMDPERQRLRSALLEYCKQDTFTLVKRSNEKCSSTSQRTEAVASGHASSHCYPKFGADSLLKRPGSHKRRQIDIKFLRCKDEKRCRSAVAGQITAD